MLNNQHNSDVAAMPPSHHHREREWLLRCLHWAVLAASCAMIVWITRDTIENVALVRSPSYMRFQAWVCVLLLADVGVEIWLSPHHWKFAFKHTFFILISIPWACLVDWTGVPISAQGAYLLSFVPMVRAGYVLAIVAGALTQRKALSLFYVYAIWVGASLYFAALMFFVEEHAINPGAGTYWDALWWASLCMTTVGSNITEYSATGRALAVILSGEGLMLFPVFTVYITNAVKR